MHSFKKATAAIAIAGILMPAAAFAQTSTTSMQTLLDQIKALQAQIQSLQQQQNVAIGQLMSTLNQGSRGENVKLLQQLLAQDTSVYPEGTISGFYGRLTAAAVKRFQKKHGLDQVGNVGPKTLKKLNEIFGKKWDSDHTNLGGHGNSSGSSNDDSNEHKPGQNKVAICHKPSSERETKYVPQPALGGHLGHGDTMGSCSGTATTTPDTTMPVISSVSATGITTTGATILWNTNENSTSQVEYGTTTSYGSTSALNNSLVTAHSVVLAGLTPNTLYNFRVWSKDASNNTATSSNMTFTTTALDATAPVLSSVVSGSIATTSALVTWNTNEAATGKVYFGTVNPLVLGSAASQATTTLSTNHSFALSGLVASTTYYFVVESADSSNNTATSSQMSFTTTN